MNENQRLINQFVQYCQNQRRLSPSTIRAYHFDIACFLSFLQMIKQEKKDAQHGL